MSTGKQSSLATADRRLGWRTPGSRLMLAGVVFFGLSIGTLVWSDASAWLHDRQRPGAQPTETLPERFDLAQPPAVMAPHAP
jgi:hypothetical protein